MRRPLAAALVAAIAAAPSPARAQHAVDTEVFRPALDGYGLFTVESAETGHAWDFGFKLTLDYAQTPLQLRIKDPTTGVAPSKAVPIIDYMAAFHLGAWVGFTDWLELAIEIPFADVGYSARYGSPWDDAAKGPTGFFVAESRTNIGAPNAAPLDPRIALKARTRRFGPVGLALILGTSVPFGDQSAFLGDGEFTFRPTGIVDVALGRFRAALNVGAIVRQKTVVLDPYDTALYPTPKMTMTPGGLIAVGSELTLSAGASYRPFSWGGIGAELFTLIPLTSTDVKDGNGNELKDYVLDALLGLQFFPGHDVTLNVGGSIGLLDSLRSPAPWAGTHDASDKHSQQFRLFTGIAWSPSGTGRAAAAARGDRDGDGIPDAIDRCPLEPEDKDGFEDEDGCPDPDNDLDGIPDTVDKCPNDPEDHDGFQDEDGCPDPDNDNDGIPDEKDLCPDEPEDKDGFQDEDGCPDPDNDNDGIPDTVDKCPNEPETWNGVDDEDGCPDTAAGATSAGAAARIEIPETIAFARRKATIGADQAALLDRIAKRIKESSDRRRVRIAGWADPGEVGRRTQQLALDRASAVRAELIKRGVDGAQLEAVGQPARTSAARGGNRRVDFSMVEP